MNLPSYIIDELKQKGLEAELCTLIDKTTELSYIKGEGIGVTYLAATRRSGGNKVHVIIEGGDLADDTIEILSGITELIKERKQTSDWSKRIWRNDPRYEKKDDTNNHNCVPSYFI